MIAGQVGIFLNSIEMMEGGRCGRRKQRNPKRKNVENGTDNDEHDEAQLDDNKNKILRDLSPTDSSYHSDRDDDSHDHHRNGDDDDEAEVVRAEVKVSKKPEAVVTEKKKEQTTEEKVSAILKEIQSATPDSTSDPVPARPSKVKQPPTTTTTTATPGAPDDPKIAELLNRRDTAVIYPEPVSDGEEQQNCEGAGSSDHEEEIVLKCMHCPQTFLRAIVLRDHMRDKHADKPLKFMCPKCDETFHQKSQLDKHLTLHSPTSQVCTVCNKTFANVYRLQRHMISHNESTDLRKFKCPECGKAFKFKHHLKEHVRIHSGEKPFVCNNCGKRFSHSGSFSSHTTSKKCWGLSSSQKGRVAGGPGPQDGVQNLTHNLSQSPGHGLKLPVTFANAKASQFQRTPLQNVPVTMAHQQHFLPNPYSQQKGIPSFYYPPQVYASTDGFLHPVFSMNQSVSHLPPGLGLSGLQGLKREAAGSSEDRERSPSVSSLTSSARSVRSISPHSQSTRSFSPHSYSGRSLSPQSSAYSLASPNPHLAHRGSTPSSASHDTTSVADRTTPATDRSTPVADRTKDSSPAASSEQISPDVNSNTKLLMVKEESSHDGQDAADKDPDTSESDLVDSSVRDDSLEEDRDENGDPRGGRRTCQYCDEIFESPVAHYQHERYMCKLNKDLVHKPESCQSPHSTVSDTSHVESPPGSSTGQHSEEEEVEELYRDSDTSLDDKKMRIRSLFTEEQQAYLKSQYLLNPRPRKYELIRIGNKIGFPKRVVQVWFQNMRARERKQGRDAAFGMANLKPDQGERDISKSPTYIPNVPKLSTVLSLTGQKKASHMFGPSPQPRTSTGETPLDLTMRPTPPLAHGGNLSRHSTPDNTHEDQVLNLSTKKEDSVERERSVEKTINKEREPSTETDKPGAGAKSLQDSAIFKYMQQEGMILNRPFSADPSASVALSLAHSIQNQLIQQSVASIVRAPFTPATPTSTQDNKPSSNNSSNSVLFDAGNETNPHHPNKPEILNCPRLVIDEAAQESTTTPTSTDLSNKEHCSPYSHTHGLTGVSPTTAEAHAMKLMQEDTHNLATLAEAAQHAANILSGKPKRLRKKTWRQMESEEVQLDFDDSQSTDEDAPASKKRRKSWKSHRVDREEGMYGCDQCNKVFSKQSSLARHKYEHSGARPFACDLCTKSFKHKHHLTEHKRLHSGEKPFQCRKCGKRFSHSGSFSQHMNHRYNYCSPGHKPGDGGDYCSPGHKPSGDSGDGEGDGDEMSPQDDSP